MPAPQSPIYIALDTPNVEDAKSLAISLKDVVGGLKLGLEFFMANGPEGVRQMADIGLPIFLDVKLHDIPNTVAGALRSLSPLGATMITLHTQGGADMMARSAAIVREAAALHNMPRPLLIGVTVLTSLSTEDLRAQGGDGDMTSQVARLAHTAMQADMDGIVCSPHEVAAMRNLLGEDATLVVPGIRPKGADIGDQKRTMTPKEALDAGADILVIGRPITQAKDPVQAAMAIAATL